MLHRPARPAGALVAVFLLAATLEPAPPPPGLSAPAGPAQATDGKAPRPHCCFNNPRYVGSCEVEPSKDETCASILEYLNNPQSQGKAYCGNTNVRGGWKQVPCEPKMQQD